MRTNAILLFIIGMLLLALVAYDSAIDIVRADKERIKENYTALTQEASRTTQMLELKESELTEKQKELVDSLAKAIKVKTKHIRSVQEIVIHDTIRDTVKVNVVNCDSLSFVKNSNCVDVSFSYKNGEGNIDIQKFTYLYIVDYERRERLFGARFLPKWGKKNTYQDIIDTCNGDTILTNRKITIVK